MAKRIKCGGLESNILSSSLEIENISYVEYKAGEYWLVPKEIANMMEKLEEYRQAECEGRLIVSASYQERNELVR